MKQLFERAQAAKQSINFATEEIKNKALFSMANELEYASQQILVANERDITLAQESISEVMLDRLRLTPERISAMAEAIRDVAKLPDPVGQVLETIIRPNGLKIVKQSIPFGVIGIIYESRPNVTADAAALALKSGNAVVLRGGKEAFNSANAIVTALRRGVEKVGLDPDIIQLVQDTSRASAIAMMKAKGYLDLLIPRGGKQLIEAVVQEAIIPVIETGTGICHAYIDATANLHQALEIVVNAKTSRPSVCNAIEVLLVHEQIASDFLSQVEKQLVDVQLRADERAYPLLLQAQKATADDFDTEFLDYILAVKVVSDVKEAIEHINQHSTGHSEVIVSQDDQSIAMFTQQIDSAAVYVNASTRFTDGGEFGLGCEMGISTQKLHARGPMGLKELTSYKYIIVGEGQVR